MEITGCISVPEEETERFDNQCDNGVSLLMVDNDEPLNMDEDGSMYIEDNPKVLGVFVSRYNIPLLQKVLELIDEYEPQIEFSVDGIRATFTPDFDDDMEEVIDCTSTVFDNPKLIEYKGE